MSKTKKILTVCLVLAVISTIVVAISAIISSETMTLVGCTTTSSVTIVILIALISSTKADNKLAKDTKDNSK